MHVVSRAFVVARDRINARRSTDEFDLVEDDPRGDVVPFRNHEKAVEHAHVRLGLGRGEHDENLIDVRGDDSFAARFAR